jgi:hypothetical protein
MQYIKKIILISLFLVWLPQSLFAQNVYVTATSGTATGNYASLTVAFNAINNGTHKGTIAIRIDADYTAGSTASINPSGSGSASYSSIYIYPNGTRVIAGNFNGPVITLNGADNVVINGINNSSNSLTIRNDYSAAQAFTILFQNGASNNSVRNCNLLASPVNTYGIVHFSATDYNDNDSISTCNIGPSPAGGYPLVSIYGQASATINYASDNVVIYNNNIYDYRHSTSNSNSYGIYIGTSQNNWKVYGNRFYQTTSISYAQWNVNYGIYVSNTVGTVDIRNNTIGYSTSIGTGTYTITAASASAGPGLYPIYIANASPSAQSYIEGNTIKEIYVKSYVNGNIFQGIVVGNGMVDIGTISGNTIGSSTGTGSVLLECMYPGGYTQAIGIYVTTSYVTSIQNNIIGSINMKYLGSSSINSNMYFYAIAQSSGGSTTFANNTIGSNAQANSIYVGYETGYSSTVNPIFRGIYSVSNTNPTVSGNLVANIVTTGTGANGTCFPIHVYNATSYSYATNNMVKYISSNSNTNGIYMEQCVANEVTGNQVNNISTTSTSAGIYSNLFNNINAVSSNLSNNSVYNISCTSFNGIFAYSCNNTTISGNSVYSITTGSTCQPVYAITCSTATISNNSIYSIASSGGFYGIFTNTCGGVTASGNNVYTISPASLFYGIYALSSTAGVSIANNSITGVSATGASNTQNYGIMVSGSSSSAASISGNTISGITTNSSNPSTTISVSLTGIYLYTIATGSSIYSNIISSLANSNTASANYVEGIILYSGTSATNGADIYFNKITNLSSSSASGVSKGIYIYVGTSNIHNNFISINNNASYSVYGIHTYYAAYTGQYNNIYYNTIYIEGSNSSAGESVCLLRDYSTATVYNNIFYNKRTSTSGNNYAISTPIYSNYTNFNLNYNLLCVNDLAKICKLSTTLQSWATYIGANTADKWSWGISTANLPSNNLFNNASAGDLTIKTGNPACWYVNGKGMPLSGYDMDWSNVSSTRSTSVANGSTDIGADEFTPVSTPTAATHSGTLTAGSTSTYTLAGRTIAQIIWQAGTPPPSTAPTVLYYTGTTPTTPIATTLYFNCYWQIDATPSTGYSYVLKLFYSDNIIGTLSSNPNLRLAKNHTGTSTGWACQCSSSGAGSTTVDAVNRTITNVTPFTSLSIFTGTDVTNPLPVEFVSLDAERAGNAIHVTWVTASEINASHFMVERSYDGINFILAGRTEASGTSNLMHTYHFYDRYANLQSATLFYRLKQVDLNGVATYTPMVAVKGSLLLPGVEVTVQPNPFSGETHIAFNLQQAEKATIEVYDLTGHPIWSKETNLEKGEQIMEIPESDKWNKGTYFLLVKGTSINYSQKLIKL